MYLQYYFNTRTKIFSNARFSTVSHMIISAPVLSNGVLPQLKNEQLKNDSEKLPTKLKKRLQIGSLSRVLTPLKNSFLCGSHKFQ